MSASTRKRNRTRTRSPSQAVNAEIVKDKHFKSGDFTLISFDKVSFKVDSIQLQAASSFFRDGSDMASGDPKIHFVDTSETAIVVRTFLELAVNGRLECYAFASSKWREDTVYLCKVIEFMKKYGCEAALRQLQQHVELKMISGEAPHLRLTRLTVFVVGAITDNKRLCTVALQDFKDVPWNYEDQIFREGRRGELFYPPEIPYFIWKQIPSHYMCALVRASADSRPKQHVFLDYLEAIGG